MEIGTAAPVRRSLGRHANCVVVIPVSVVRTNHRVFYAYIWLAIGGAACSAASPELPASARVADAKTSGDLRPTVGADFADPLVLGFAFLEECPTEATVVAPAVEQGGTSADPAASRLGVYTDDDGEFVPRAYDLGDDGCAVLSADAASQDVAEESSLGLVAAAQAHNTSVWDIMFVAALLFGPAAAEQAGQAIRSLWTHVGIAKPASADHAKLLALIAKYGHDPAIFALGAQIVGEEVLFILETPPLADGNGTALAHSSSAAKADQAPRRLVPGENAVFFDSDTGGTLLLPTDDEWSAATHLVYQTLNGAVLLMSAPVDQPKCVCDCTHKWPHLCPPQVFEYPLFLGKGPFDASGLCPPRAAARVNKPTCRTADGWTCREG